MRKVTAQRVDTFVQADRTDMNAVSQKQRQVASAFNALGVNVRQRVQQRDEDELNAASASASSFIQAARHKENQKASLEDLQGSEGYAKAMAEIDSIDNARTREKVRMQFQGQLTATLSKHAADLREEQKEARLRLKVDGINANAKLAFDWMKDVSNRNMTPEQFRNSEQMQDVLAEINAIPDAETKAAKLQDFKQTFDATMIGIERGLQREDDITDFGKVVADGLQDYKSGSINKYVDEHKGVLGPDAVTSAARIALSVDEVEPIDDLLSRDDLHPETIAALQNGRDRIIAAKAKAEKADKVAMMYALNQANEIEDRGERSDALVSVYNNHDDKMTDAQKAKVLSDVTELQKEIKTENVVKQSLGNLTTRQLADPKNLPDGLKALPISEIKQIQNREFETAAALGAEGLPRMMHLLRNPTDMPSAAKDYFGTFISGASGASPDELSPELQKQWSIARALESNMGAGKMRTLLGDKEYAEFQVVNGIAQQEGLETAVAKFQEYRLAIANGNPQTPEDFPTIKRNVLDSVVGELEDKPMSLIDFDVMAGSVNSTLTPYFKVWGAIGLTESQMETQAKRIINNTAWNGMVGGTVTKEAFEAAAFDEDGPIYDESPEELYEIALEQAAEKYLKLQPHIGELKVTPLATDPSKLMFTSEDGIPVINGIKPVDSMIDLLEGKVQTRKDKILNPTKQIIGRNRINK